MLSLFNVSSIAAPAAIATSAARAGAVARNPMMNFIPLIFIGTIFYMLIIRPQQKSAKAHKQMLLELKQGDKIITNGGIVGIIKNIDETSFINIVTATDTMLEITKDNIVKKI